MIFKYKIGEVVNVINGEADGIHDTLGVVIYQDMEYEGRYIVQIDNSDWEWYVDEDLEKFKMRNGEEFMK